jgi:hypothetical protein
MTFGEIQLKRIQDKLQGLLKDYSSVQKENLVLKEQVEKSALRETQLKNTIDELRQQVNILKLNAGEMTDSDKKEIEKKINAYIKEIDRCITLLSE